jgi:hypothetical protein
MKTLNKRQKQFRKTEKKKKINSARNKTKRIHKVKQNTKSKTSRNVKSQNKKRVIERDTHSQPHTVTVGP